MNQLESKVCLVTGASRGIGCEIARLFASEGGKVVAVARTLHEGDQPLGGSLTAVVREIREAGGEAIACRANIANENECQRAVETARQAFGPLDVLVNNAVFPLRTPVALTPVDKWLLATAVNFHAPFFLSRLALADMIPRRRGAIVNVSSIGAIGPGRGPYEPAREPPHTLYGATKAALERFTQGLASEVYEAGISVSCVSPSQMVLTESVEWILRRTSEFDVQMQEASTMAEPIEYMARAVLLLATQPLELVSGRVTYSQKILREFGELEEAEGAGIDTPGSGFSSL